ncbi:MAG: metal ABC transporter permease [Thiotrichales bacterium]|nr:metal ABC transporter permease [Thiotrichales bacterium]
MIEFDALDISILGPALVVGTLVLATHAPLGRQVIQRGIIFIDLAIAQIAGLGVLAAMYFGFEIHSWPLQLFAIGSALLATLIFAWCETHWPKYQESIIGISFILAATAALIIVSKDPHGSEHLNEILAGQILWTTWDQVLILAIATSILLILMKLMPINRHRISFYVIFSVSITISVQFIGVYLVFASLIIPALASINYSDKNNHLYTWLLGVTAYFIGLASSALFDLPSGPTIVWALALTALSQRLITRRLS